MRYTIVCNNCLLPFTINTGNIINVYKPVKCPMSKDNSVCYLERTCDFCPIEREVIFKKAMCSNCHKFTEVF